MAAEKVLCASPASEVTKVMNLLFISRGPDKSLIILRNTTLFLSVILFLVPPQCRAWGKSAQRLVANQAIDTLPQEIRPFFESNRTFLVQHVTDSLEINEKNIAEKH